MSWLDGLLGRKSERWTWSSLYHWAVVMPMGVHQFESRHRRFGDKYLKATVAQWLKDFLAVSGPAPIYMQVHTPSGEGYEGFVSADHLPSGTRLLYSRDTGHHTSGWFKNPDYERCIHLSLSFRDPETGANLRKDEKLSREWIDLMFGSWKRYIWTESPKGSEGKRADVWHYRVFCDSNWQPIIPRGEVYSRELTEAGWKSFSEVQEENNA